MEFEKLLDKRLNALKEENTKTLNEYAFLSKQQNDLNDKISKKLEERENKLKEGLEIIEVKDYNEILSKINNINQ